MSGKEAVNLPLSGLTGRKLLFFRIALFGVFPVALLVTGAYLTGAATCDSETLVRFVKPFMFNGVNNLEWAASESYSYGIVRPLYGISFFVDFSLWGTSFAFYHATDILLSWVTFVMAYLLFRRRFGRFVSSLAVTFWAVLPLQSYSLVSFVGRNDRLMTIIILGALLAYDRALTSAEHRRKWLLIALAIFSAGMFSKESIFYYSLFLFSWSVIASGRKTLVTLKQDMVLWGGMIIVTVLYFSLRLLLRIPMGNPTDYNTGVDYLNLLGRMVSWSFPVQAPPALYPAIGIFSYLAVAAMIFIRKIPSDIRYGSFCLFIGFLHIPVFWVQKCFLWLPWLWGSLAVAGVLSILVQWAGRKFGRPGRSAAYVLTASILGFSVLWSRMTIGQVTHPALICEAAVSFILENSEEGDYSMDILYSMPEKYGTLLPEGSSHSDRQDKYLEYMEYLLQIRLNDPEAMLIPFSE